MLKISEELEQMSASGDFGVALDGLHERVAALEIELDDLRTELDAALRQWNEIVLASGSKTHGGAIGHVAAMRAELGSLRAELEAARKQEPCGWQCRFITPTETWGYCSKEHYETVKAAPHEYPGYEVRAVYASPVPTKISKGAAQVLIHAAISENPELLELFCSQAPAQQNADTAQFSRDPYDLADELYLRGYSDCRLERDYDPRGGEEWQAVVDAIGSEVKR